jgi:hypothetical protein
VWAVCMPPDAGAAYEKADFKVQDEKHCTYLEKLLGAQGFVRLRREL